MALVAIAVISANAQNITARLIDLPRPLKRNILSINKDDDGFLWFRNSQGLWRFDGSNAKLFDAAKLKLKGNVVIQLFSCFDHFLFVLDFNNKLHVYDQLNDTAYTFQLGVPQIYNFIHTKNNRLLFFGADGHGYIFSRKTMLQNGPDLTTLKGWRKEMHVYASAIDPIGNRLYVYTGHFVGYVEGDSLITADTYGGKTVDYARTFVTNNGFDITSKYLVLHHSHGFLLFDKNTLALLHMYDGLDIAGRVIEDDKLVLLAKKKETEFPSYMQSTLFSLAPPVVDGDFSVYGIVPGGSAGNYFVAGDMGLVELTFHRQKIDTFYKKELLVQAFANKSIRGIYRFNNHLYVGTYNGFYDYDGKTATKLAGHIVYSMAAADSQTLLLGIENVNGLVVYNTISQKSTLPFKGSRINAVRCLYPYQGLYWGGVDNGIYQFYTKNGLWTRNVWFSDTSLGAVRQIAVRDGLWYIASQNGFFVLDKNKRLKKIYPQSGSAIVYAFTINNNGFFLATHGNGIISITQKGMVQASYSLAEGLQGNYVYSLVKTGSLLVAGTSAGPSVFLTDGTRVKPVPLAEEDENGVFDQECNHGAFFYDTISRQAILGGLQGLMFVDHDYYTAHANDKPDKVLLSYIKLVGDISKPAPVNLFAYSQPIITVPPNQSYIVLKFSSPLNFTHTEGFMRIKGISDSWQSFNLSDEVNLIKLPPGKYTLEARLGESLDPHFWFVKTLVVLPAFYQTLWFKSLIIFLVALLATGLVYMFWRSKIRKLRAEQQLRATIASDLHDDIGSTLNSISVYAEIANQQAQADNAKLKALLDKMGMASRSMIDTMSDIVWAVNPKNDDFENVLRRMQFFAGELLSGKNIVLNFELDDRVKKLKLTMQERKNVYLIFKEAVNNIFKYAEATEVTISLTKDGNFLAINIVDDGKGFNPGEKSGTGNGLTNIKSRAVEIGGEIMIKSETHKGTQLFLRLKIA